MRGALRSNGVAMPRSAVHPVDAYVGRRVRELRKKNNMSQSRLADQLGITFQQVQKYEKGTNRISSSRLQHIGQILDVGVPYFFVGAPSVVGITNKTTQPVSADPVIITRFIASDDGRSLAKAFRRISDATLRRSIVHLVEALTEAAN
jgi:transcriptional regulator with XRE-family HTH domain